jgi:hypothetical protein
MVRENQILHKILKDSTRREIILLLDEKGSLSYTDILEEVGIDSTGLLNYHLRVMGDLISKDQEGNYSLTEDGKLALRLLSETSQESGLQRENGWEKRFWKAMILFSIGSLIITVTIYYIGLISLSSLYQSLIWILPAVSVFFVLEYIMRNKAPKGIRTKYKTANYYARGIVLGFFLWFGLIFILALTGASRQVSLLGIGQIPFLIAVLIVCFCAGTVINEWQVKKGMIHY